MFLTIYVIIQFVYQNILVVYLENASSVEIHYTNTKLVRTGRRNKLALPTLNMFYLK